MSLPSNLRQITEWLILGPMGPALPTDLSHHPVMGVDGGAAHFPSLMKVWVGDADSYQGQIKADHCFQFSPEKNLSDLALALSYFTETQRYTLHLWGFLGGRGDHELFNLGEASHFLQTHPNSKITFYDKQGQIRFEYFAQGDWELTINSIFSLGAIEKVGVSLEGNCDYPISPKQELRPLSSLGLSNKGHGQIRLRLDGPAFIYYPEQT